ncbi:hypothetical protein [Amycolatopsis granulosa]|nr:hypothetical protein [Amycolatopsis granulosa]NIH86797.1 hypothetical protein [Amycolatopsis granulosa]
MPNTNVLISGAGAYVLAGEHAAAGGDHLVAVVANQGMAIKTY